MAERTAESTPDLEESSRADPVKAIGERLTLLRAHKNRKISALARQVGVSPSLISQIERGQSRPSVSTLFALAEALEVPVDAFFRDGVYDARGWSVAEAADTPEVPPPANEVTMPAAPSGHRYMVRRDERAAIEIEGGVRWERLTPAALPNAEFLELVYAPRAESNSELYRHPGTEMVVVTEGRLDIHVGFDRYELGPGDSIHFPSAFPHRYVNPTGETARAITVILLEPNAPAPSMNDRRP